MPPKIAYALVGDPINNSPSPAMHNAAFAELNMNAEYRLRPTKPEDKEVLLAEIRHGKWAGLNITTPLTIFNRSHIIHIYPFCERR